MLVVSPEFKCSNEVLSIAAMLSGEFRSPLVYEGYWLVQVPNVWLRPPNQRREADAAKALLSVPDGDHLTLLNVYNNYIQSMSSPLFHLFYLTARLDAHIKSWTWDNYLSARALSQAENVRTQLLRTMERNDLDILSIDDERRLYDGIKQALICGFFIQVVHKGGEKGSYVTAEDNQVWRAVQLWIRNRLWPEKLLNRSLHCIRLAVLTHNRNGICFNEFAFTTNYYIRTVTAIKPQWWVQKS